jgi:hypothetical protein
MRRLSPCYLSHDRIDNKGQISQAAVQPGFLPTIVEEYNLCHPADIIPDSTDLIE